MRKIVLKNEDKRTAPDSGAADDRRVTLVFPATSDEYKQARAEVESCPQAASEARTVDRGGDERVTPAREERAATAEPPAGGYVPLLQRAAGAAYFFRKMRGAAVPSSALMAPMTQRFVDAIKSFAARNGIEIVSFRRGERKDDRTRQYLRRWAGGEGVLYIGKAQEKARVVRTERRHDPATGDTYPWLAASTAMVDQFYFYAVDDDFGPFFLKFCSYFPTTPSCASTDTSTSSGS